MSTALDLLKKRQLLRRAWFAAPSGSLEATAAFMAYEAACEAYDLCLCEQHVLERLGWLIAQHHRRRAEPTAEAA